MSETKSLTSRLPVEKFKHTNMTMSRADKWSEFKTSLKSAFGQFFPLLAQQLDHECDPTKEVWGLPCALAFSRLLDPWGNPGTNLVFPIFTAWISPEIIICSTKTSMVMQKFELAGSNVL